MVTFSLIVPVYNVEKYLSKCLDSILNQTFDDFEVIIVNDGSPDNSQDIINYYVGMYPNKIKAYVKENGGLSDARNFGIERASGDYMLFIDSDDYISAELLSQVNSVIKSDHPDVIRFAAQVEYQSGEKGEIIGCPEFSSLNGELAINELIDYKQYFEPACFYVYKRDYWIENRYLFNKGRYHEDFGLIPEVIIKSKCVSSINFIGYYYVQSTDSIMRTASPEKDIKRAYDSLHHFDHLISVCNSSINSTLVKNKFASYIANSIITRVDHIPKSAKKEYISAIKERKVFNLLLDDTFARRIKKILLKIKYICV